MLFACIFVPDFAAEAVVRAEPELRGQAVVVVDGTPPLLKVVAANDRARAAGIMPGMTNVQAAARLFATSTTHDSNRKIPGRNSSERGAVRRRSPAQETAAHAALSDCARAFSPRVEECAPDTVLLDLDGLERLFGSPQKMARDLARRASEVGLEANVAVAANLDAAICAARGFAGVTVLPAGKEADRLGPLPVDVLLQAATSNPAQSPTGIPAAQSGTHRKSKSRNQKAEAVPSIRSQDLLETLDRWGVRTFRALAALPEIAVSERLGSEGVYLQTLCRGRGSRTLSPSDAPLNFEEAIELEYPIEDLEALAFVLNRMIEQLCARLSARALSTNELRLQMELERLGEYEIEKHGVERIRTDQDSKFKIHNSKLVLPVPMLDAKTFLRLLQLDLRANPPLGPVAKIWLRAEPVHPRHSQGGLFLPTAPEPERLEVTLARIGSVVGQKTAALPENQHAEKSRAKNSGPHHAFNIGAQADRGTHTVLSDGIPTRGALPLTSKSQDQAADNKLLPPSAPTAIPSCVPEMRVGTPEILDTHRPGAFRMKRFTPPDANTGASSSTRKGPVSLRSDPAGQTSNNGVRAIRPGSTALRVFRPPVLIEIDTEDIRPTHMHSASFQTDISGPIAWCAGPWRTSGEWWNESWSRDEWDVAVETPSGRALCRIYRDTSSKQWFLEAIYD